MLQDPACFDKSCYVLNLMKNVLLQNVVEPIKLAVWSNDYVSKKIPFPSFFFLENRLKQLNSTILSNKVSESISHNY
jgi:hypothetical protein